MAPGARFTGTAEKFVKERLPARTTVVGSGAPEAFRRRAPGNPFIVQGVDDVLRRPKLTSNVPAAPWLPITLIANALAPQDVVVEPDVVVDDEDEDELDEVGELVAGEWAGDEHAPRAHASAAAASAPR